MMLNRKKVGKVQNILIFQDSSITFLELLVQHRLFSSYIEMEFEKKKKKPRVLGCMENMDSRPSGFQSFLLW